MTPGSPNYQASPYTIQNPSQEPPMSQTRTDGTDNQVNTGSQKSKGEKVLDGSIKAANWIMYGDVGGKEEAERKKKEKKERRRNRKKGRDDDAVEADWIMEILQVIA
ncbi:hypothetical protein TWF730_000843 [Orbilia blumenaviensis]|uniref:Uncharacterized protein n=1 Tax=Orbilia blumenaviensis TaxID=1796055 RepID=A0AAV9VPR7_9PEZI